LIQRRDPSAGDKFAQASIVERRAVAGPQPKNVPTTIAIKNELDVPQQRLLWQDQLISAVCDGMQMSSRLPPGIGEKGDLFDRLTVGLEAVPDWTTEGARHDIPGQ
jgi:hypothetical protein